MGNVCSSGQSKKKNSLSEKSEESYNINDESVKEMSKNIPSVESTGNIAENFPKAEKHTEYKPKEPENSNSTKLIDDNSYTTPSTAPVPASECSRAVDSDNTDSTFSWLLQGKPMPSCKTEKNKKIVLYVLSDNSADYVSHKRIIYGLQSQLTMLCQSKGFELLISDVHNINNSEKSCRLLETSRWSQSPLEAQGGHDEAANCIFEITRHLSSGYLVPILFLGSSLGTPMLPLTIESQDFTQILNNASEAEKILLEKWYIIDNCNQPMCHRLNTNICNNCYDGQDDELNTLFNVLLRLFSDDLKDSYLSTVVEQEVNNTVLMNQELAKRCLWIQTSPQYIKAQEDATLYDLEILRRMSKLYTELKKRLSENHFIRILPTLTVTDEDLSGAVSDLLNKAIASIMDEHHSKVNIPHNTNGVDHIFLEEIEEITHYSKMLAQNSPNFDIITDVKRYIKDGTTQPLFVVGPSGCGKSVFISKIIENIHKWKPDANLILRYGNLSARSSDAISILGSIAYQMSVQAYGHPIRMTHSIEHYSKVIRDIIKSSKCFFVIIIDSIDDVLGGKNFDWLPDNLGTMTKVILTLTQNNDDDKSLINNLISGGISSKSCIKMKQFSERQWQDILSSGAGDFYAATGSVKIPDEWKNLNGKTPFHAKALWWLAWLGHTSIKITEISEIPEKMLDVMESTFSGGHAEQLMLLLALPQWGLRENEYINIFQRITQIPDVQVTYKIWSKFCWLMGPMLLSVRNLRLADKLFKNAIISKYTKKQAHVHQIIREYYDRQGNLLAFKDIKTNYNQQKFLNLPYHHIYHVMEDSNNGLNKVDIIFHCFYFTELQWMADKVHAIDPVHLWNDIVVSEALTGISEQPYMHITLLKNFLKDNMYELTYDGRQFYTLIKYYIRSNIRENHSLNDNQIIRSWLEATNELVIPFLDILNTYLGDELENEVNSFDTLANLPHPGYFVASISTEREEICIWDVKHCTRIRVLQGMPQPSAICPYDSYSAAVLCRREIKVINLEDGKIKVTLKGVMNQKMPYFGLHDQKHLVCLSRNRMYVNLMNLESGDCVTTFKAGEDRFLNSLLVSGDGRILVCGDETQKPFPLLVWHLSQRKLLYDLRIPHHDFITSLSAITYEGSYVCVVAKELNEPTPNFIVVYDLQSGTLFKKWKPACNTVSLAISQVNACVIAGLADAKILIWDLITGNCRSTLTGHNAPVTSLKLDPLGKVLLSTDKEGRDNAIRLWELKTGKSLAVFKPPSKISACEVLPNCTYIVVALTNRTELLTLSLNNFALDSAADDNPYMAYGSQENQNKIFKLN